MNIIRLLLVSVMTFLAAANAGAASYQNSDVTRLIDGTGVSHVFVGLVKAPAFALLIGVIGCQAGLGVGKTAESLGQMTSRAVVAAIFAVILADALFSILFQRLGV